VDFKNTVVIMTSNLGSQWLLGDAPDEDKVLESVRQHFKPEFLNRVDEIIVFHRLSREHITDIVQIQLRELEERLSRREVTLKLTDAATGYLAEQGYDPAYGARPLKRVIQKEIENQLALKLLDGTFGPGDTITVDVVDDALTFAS
jgi:ATP-dependent Clp protease ATP-binding subunit ClpB